MADRVEIYLAGSSNRDASVRLLGDTDTGTIGLPNLRLQILASGAWVDVELDTPAATAAVAALWGAIGGTLTDQTDLVAALALKAPLASPALTGTPTVPTAAATTNTTQAASTAYVRGEVTTEATARSTADALLAPLASPALTGNPTAPTQTAANNSTRVATTAYADGAVATEATARSSADATLQPLSSKLTAQAALTWAADTIAYFTSASVTAATAFTAYGRLVVGQALTPAADQITYWSTSTVQSLTGITALARTILALTTAALWRNAIDKGATALTDAATIATDCSTGNVFTVTLGGNRTLGAPTNLAAGASYTWAITQDGTGTRTLAYNAAFDFGAKGSPTLTTTASKTDYITGYSPDGTKLHVSFNPGFS